jgi:crotonobetainyl-CoA:carnitine CoA-transferase CaiB-like acyl-CoA transferase
VSIGSLPLARFTVLDLCHARAGPTAVRQLADWGANVIKIEPPGEARGDVTGSRREGFDFQNLHRNKRGLTLNLKTEEGKAIFFKLAENADVVVENFRSEVKYRLGVDYDSVKKVNPRIVYGSISGFGQTGPYSKRPGVDQIAQGMGGLMSITGLPGQGPVRVGIPVDDLCAGLLLAQGMLMALIERETSGVGQWVHTSLLEAQIFMLDFQASRWLMAGEVAKQAGVWLASCALCRSASMTKRRTRQRLGVAVGDELDAAHHAEPAHIASSTNRRRGRAWWPSRPSCRCGTESSLTLRWRGVDSNFQFRVR